MDRFSPFEKDKKLSGGLLALKFGEVFLEDEVADELAAFGGEWELVGGHELLDDDAGHHFFGVGGIGEELGVLGDAGVGLGFEGGDAC